jgi:hypothetical protein
MSNNQKDELIEKLKKELDEKGKKLFVLEKRLKEEIEKNKYLEGRIIILEKDIKTLKENEKKLKYEIKLNLDGKNKVPALEALIKKDLEIEDLKKKLSRFPFILEEGESLMHINIVNNDYNIQNFSIICKNSDVFNQLENKLYEEYPMLKDIPNYFIFNGQIIQKYKSLQENGIKDNDIIIMYKMEMDD